MPTTTHGSEAKAGKVRRVAEEAARRAKEFDGWTAYEAAKGYVRREYPGLRKDQYDAIIDAIKTRLEI
ncbi:hypothetical protein [Salinibacter altiplanensis]|uniref:hypothetical protein n=1 Tax=Salinibacter altiplanensis TaxID=1803181 RepID=UPI000C9FABEB|nr:hypothetical protein [Salinibacter altiplanensis]